MASTMLEATNTSEAPINGQIFEANNGGKSNNDENADFLADSDDEDDFVVTIGEIKANVPFKNQNNSAGGGGGGAAGVKPELDGLPSFKGTQIYDLDLATMEDKPWRKPGSDITDYFNFGFNEDTWNQYCERQKKLRVEYNNNQEAINRAIFNSISIPVAPQLTTLAGGRQLVSILGAEKPTSKPIVPIMRTVITGSGTISQNLLGNQSSDGINTSSSNFTPQSNTTTTTTTSNQNSNTTNTLDFSKPPPTSFSQPPPSFDAPPPQSATATTIASAVPTAHKNSSTTNLIDLIKVEAPPGIETPPGFEDTVSTMTSLNIGVIGGGINTTLPPPGTFNNFNPNVPPPGMASGGGVGGRLQIPGMMNLPPPSLFATQQSGGGNSGSAGFGGGGYSRPNFSSRYNSSTTLPPGIESGGGGGRSRLDYSSDESDSGSYRRKRSRRRSRSYSPRRRRDDKDRDRDSYSRRDYSPPSSSSRKRKTERDRSSRERDRSSRERDRSSRDRGGGASERDRERGGGGTEKSSTDKKRSSNRAAAAAAASDEKDTTEERGKRKKHDKTEKE